MLELACPTAYACLFKVRHGILHMTLTHMWDKLNLPIFIPNVELLTLIKVDGAVFQLSLRPDEVHGNG